MHPPTKKILIIVFLMKKNKQKSQRKKKKAAATVRYKFFSIFPETIKEDDWQFFGWVAKEYGLDICLEKEYPCWRFMIRQQVLSGFKFCRWCDKEGIR